MSQLEWRRSTYSGSGNCVEVAAAPGRVLVRDSKLGEQSPVLVVSPAGFAAVLRDLRRDLLG